jgi:hypothetical protein
VERAVDSGVLPLQFGARSSLVAAAAWLIAATAVAVYVAPNEWRLRVVVFGLASLTPALLAIRPSFIAACVAAACWAIPGILLLPLEGLGGVWLFAAASAFTGAIAEGHRRGAAVPTDSA